MASTVVSDSERDVDPRRGRPCEPRSVRVAALIAFLAAGAALGVMWLVSPQARASVGLDLLLWAGVVTVASVWPVGESEGNPYLALDLPVLLACAFVAGPFAAGLVAIVASTTRQELRGRMALSRCVWNHSQVALSVMAAGLVFGALGGDPMEWPRMLVASEAALAADAVVNYLCVAMIYALGSERGLWSVVRTLHVGTPRYFAMFYAGLGLVAALMATLYAYVGAISLLVFVVPMLLARETLRQTLAASGAKRDLASRREALRRVDQRIAEERADERSRIAAALHDDVLQRVFDVTVRAHVVKECYRRGQLLELEEAVPALVAASGRLADELRDVIHGLRRSRVGHAGLVDTLSLLVAHLHDQSGINIVADLEPCVRVSPQAELLVYLVAREALVNASRHSEADTIWVSLQRAGSGVELRILDNGVGFDPSERRDRHFGLELMDERVASAGGTLRVESSPGNGALIVACFSATSLGE